jgi:hypothetical protein
VVRLFDDPTRAIQQCANQRMPRQRGKQGDSV